MGQSLPESGTVISSLPDPPFGSCPKERGFVLNKMGEGMPASQTCQEPTINISCNDSARLTSHDNIDPTLFSFSFWWLCQGCLQSVGLDSIWVEFKRVLPVFHPPGNSYSSGTFLSSQMQKDKRAVLMESLCLHHA